MANAIDSLGISSHSLRCVRFEMADPIWPLVCKWFIGASALSKWSSINRG
jgi:hypothetical protein